MEQEFNKIGELNVLEYGDQVRDISYTLAHHWRAIPEGRIGAIISAGDLVNKEYRRPIRRLALATDTGPVVENLLSKDEIEACAGAFDACASNESGESSCPTCAGSGYSCPNCGRDRLYEQDKPEPQERDEKTEHCNPCCEDNGPDSECYGTCGRFNELVKDKPQEWVDGLPAVGSQCRMSYLMIPGIGPNVWQKVLIKAYWEGQVWIQDAYNTEVVMPVSSCEFRPLKTPEQLEAERKAGDNRVITMFVRDAWKGYLSITDAAKKIDDYYELASRLRLTKGSE